MNVSSRKACRDCGCPEPEGGFYKHSRGRLTTRRICGSCSAGFLRETNRSMRIKCLLVLGGVCAICGNGELEFLTVDHILQDGSEERKKLHPDQIKRKILRDPSCRSRYRVLCRNCNDSLEIGTVRGPAATARDQSRRRRRMEVRLEIIHFLGDVCACCSEDHPDKLTVDHVHDDGASSDGMPRGGFDLYKKILDGRIPKERFQLLCWNCNFSKHLGGGECVHRRRKGQVG